MFDISILKNTIEGMASDADDNGEKDFAIRLTVEDAFALCRLESVRHGHWIEKELFIPWCDDDVDIIYECSCCETESGGTSPYCPNCGAKMDEVSEC